MLKEAITSNPAEFEGVTPENVDIRLYALEKLGLPTEDVDKLSRDPGRSLDPINRALNPYLKTYKGTFPEVDKLSPKQVDRVAQVHSDLKRSFFPNDFRDINTLEKATDLMVKFQNRELMKARKIVEGLEQEKPLLKSYMEDPYPGDYRSWPETLKQVGKVAETPIRYKTKTFTRKDILKGKYVKASEEAKKSLAAAEAEYKKWTDHYTALKEILNSARADNALAPE